MRKAKAISESLLSLVNEAIEERKRMSERQSELDRAISDIMHELELVRLNTVQAYKVTVRLQELLRERREVKCEMNTLRVLCESFTTHNILPQVSKVDEKVSDYVKKESNLVHGRNGVIKSILGAKKVAMI